MCFSSQDELLFPSSFIDTTRSQLGILKHVVPSSQVLKYIHQVLSGQAVIERQGYSTLMVTRILSYSLSTTEFPQPGNMIRTRYESVLTINLLTSDEICRVCRKRAIPNPALMTFEFCFKTKGVVLGRPNLDRCIC